MIEDIYIPNDRPGPDRVPEARYAYYRRCQLFRKNGEQCKAPAEKESRICHMHASQHAMELRRKISLMVVLAEVVRRMRARGKPEFEVADIFMDFNAIQVTFGVMAQALIDGRIDCKTSGRLAVGLQTAAKLLWMLHRKGREGRKESQISPRISADERRLGGRRASTTKDTRSIPLSRAQGRSGQAAEHEDTQMFWAAKRLANQGEETRVGFVAEKPAFRDIRGPAHAPPGWARAA